MLHIILGILKLIGIVLAVLLALILLVVLSIVFVPVRYRGRIAKTEEEMSGQVQVTWLFRMISVLAAYDVKKKESRLVIRLFGIPLEHILGFFKKLAGMIGKLARLKEKLPARKRKKGTDAWEDAWDEPVPVEKKNKDAAVSAPVSESEPAADQEIESERSIDQEPQERQEQTSCQDGESEQDSPEKKSILARLAEIPGRIEGLIEKITTVIGNVTAGIKAALEKIRNIFGSLERLGQKIAQIPDYIASFETFLEQYEVKTVAGDLIREVKYLLSHYMPKKAEGYIHFGTGDPAMVGQLTGILYMILPVQAGKVEIQPEFTEKVFETDLRIKGHIRVFHALRIAWHLFRNKKLMRLLKKVQKMRR